MAQQFLDSTGLARVLSAVNQKISDSAGPESKYKFWIGKESDFEKIYTKDNNTIYFVYDTSE